MQEILRKQLKFSGVIFSDDLNMDGAGTGNNHADRARSALDAGCDMVLICNNRAAAISILEQLPQKYFVDEKKFKTLQGKFSQTLLALHASSEWQEKNNFLKKQELS